MNDEKYLTLAQLQDALAQVLPERPAKRTLYTWMSLSKYPMPYIPKPGIKGAVRTGRWFQLSQVRHWLQNPADYYAWLAVQKKALPRKRLGDGLGVSSEKGCVR